MSTGKEKVLIFQTVCEFFCSTYALTVISNRIAAIGIMNNPSQKTGDENRIWSMPTKTAASGIDGQKLLQIEQNSRNQFSLAPKLKNLNHLITYIKP